VRLRLDVRLRRLASERDGAVGAIDCKRLFNPANALADAASTAGGSHDAHGTRLVDRFAG